MISVVEHVSESGGGQGYLTGGLASDLSQDNLAAVN
jgi:hypothetical protein